MVMLRDGQQAAGDVRFLKRVRSRSARLPSTCPVMQTIGEESSMAVAIPVTILVAPGPDVATATPTRPEARA